MSNPDLFSGGPLAFPVTPFGGAGEMDVSTFKKHVEWLVGFGTPALFVGCGTGEIASLDVDEIAELVRAAKEVAPSGTAVIAGVGQGLRVAQRTLRSVTEAGADAALVLPPYLIVPEQRGLHDYYSTLASTTDLPLVLYQRDNARFEPETVAALAELPSVIGLKDGLGDVELMQRIVTTVGDDLQYFNGMPTAETFQDAYSGLGVHNYSSAVFNYVPEVAWAFYRAHRDGDAATKKLLLSEFFVPLARIRLRVRGYAVSLVKAGVNLRWGPVGSVRPPLVDAAPEDVRELEALLERSRELVSQPAEG